MHVISNEIFFFLSLCSQCDFNALWEVMLTGTSRLDTFHKQEMLWSATLFVLGIIVFLFIRHIGDE